MKSDTYRISELATIINRVPHTIREWERTGRLPQSLRPERDERGWRLWTGEQVEAIKEWIIKEDLRPGKGLISYHERR